MKQFFILSISLLLLISCEQNQENKKINKGLSKQEKIDSTKIKTLFNSALTEGKSYEWTKMGSVKLVRNN